MSTDMRFGIIRDTRSQDAQEYTLDDKRCPDCHSSTVVGEDPRRRYCSNKKCNAFILEKSHQSDDLDIILRTA